MRFAFFFSLFFVFSVVLAPAHAVAPEKGFADLAERLTPSVVNISTSQKIDQEDVQKQMEDMFQMPEGSPFEPFFRKFFEQMPQGETGQPMPPREVSALGSGFIIDAEQGLVITNSHVVQQADEVTVILHDDTQIQAEIVGDDPKTDLAVLRIKTDKKLQALTWGDSDKMRVGDWVVAIGNPFGLGGTVTAGIISAQQRDINVGPYDSFIQTDASINRGNSGGPMFNLDGEIIGINTAIFSPTGGSVGIGFAVPSNMAQPVIDQILKYGRTKRGWLGVRIEPVSEDLAESLGLDEAHGAFVHSVTPDSPSDGALEASDIILEFDGQKIEDMRELPRIVAATDVGKKVKVIVWRDGKRVIESIALGELEEAEENGLLDGPKEKKTPKNDGKSIDKLGLKVMTLTPALRRQFEIEDGVDGVMITDVNTESDAAKKRLRPGDVISEANQMPVASTDDLKKIVENTDRKAILLQVKRGRDQSFIALSLE